MTAIRPTGEQLGGFIDDLEVALGYEAAVMEGISDVILCGMGGSAISGDIVADCCRFGSSVPIRVLKTPCVPNWAGPGTLAIVSSYSGNTIETLGMYDRLKAKGCRIVAMTSGGLLKGRAEKDGIPLIMLPDDMHPRHSIGYMIGYTLAILRSAGCPDLEQDIVAFLPALRAYRESMEAPDSVARRMASCFVDRVPLICSDSSLRSVVLRWKTQVNENSKHVAFCGTLPEARDCMMEAARSYGSESILPAILSGCGSADVDRLAEDLYRMGVRFEYLKLDGRSSLENLFRAVILGDYISMYMAELRGIDSADVKPIRQLKARIKELPGNTEGAS